MLRLPQPPSKSKYRNKKIKADGYTFDSEKEYLRYYELKLLEKAGNITDLKIKERFELVPKTPRFKNSIYYESDFTYTDENNNFIIEDVKPDFSNLKSEKAYKKTNAYYIFKIKKRWLYERYGYIITEI